MTLFATLFALSLIIVVHELGHLCVAKWSGVEVYEFSIGMGPAIAGVTINHTRYTLRCLPLGGFVRLAGLDESTEPLHTGTSFYNVGLVRRMAIIAAGSITNVIFGFVLFFLANCFYGTPLLTPYIADVVPNYPAAEAGLRSGDWIKSVDGDPVYDVRNDFVKKIQESQTGVKIAYERDGTRFSVVLLPILDPKVQVRVVGVQLEATLVKGQLEASVVGAGEATYMAVAMVGSTLKQLINGAVSLTDLSGPVGLFQVAKHQIHEKNGVFFRFLGVISIAIGLFNLLPIPVLDGGHLVFLSIEAVFRKRLPTSVIKTMTVFFTLLLLALTVIVGVNDVVFWSDRDALLHRVEQP